MAIILRVSKLFDMNGLHRKDYHRCGGKRMMALLVNRYFV